MTALLLISVVILMPVLVNSKMILDDLLQKKIIYLCERM